MKHEFVMTTRTYAMEITKGEWVVWDTFWRFSPIDCNTRMSGIFDSLQSIDWSGHYGAMLYFTVSDDSELDGIKEYIEKVLNGEIK